MHLNWSNWFSGKPSSRFSSNESLFDGLKKADSAAILYLQSKVLPSIKMMVKSHGLQQDCVEDILNQSILIFLQKINDGSYQYVGNSPSTYLIQIARRVTLLVTRDLKNTAQPLDSIPENGDPDFEKLSRHQEAAEMVALLLGKLGPPCDQLIQLYHIDGLSDEEIIAQQLTRYTNTDSLKSKRSQCMKKLVQLGEQWKNLINI